jgi:hypothetical protein
LECEECEHNGLFCDYADPHAWVRFRCFVRKEEGMKKTLWFSLGMVFMLSGCIPPKIVNHPAPDLKVDFTPFEDAGCPLNDSGYTRICEEGSVLYNLECDRLSAISDEFGALSPAYPMAICTYVPYGRPDVAEPWNTPASEYFYNVGGPMPMLVRYVIFVNSEFKLIKNADEFRAIFAPVDSEEEALSFALALADVYTMYNQVFNIRYRYEVRTLDDTYVESTDDGYIVHVFDYQFYGCGPHYYYAVDLNVTSDGRVDEISRTKIYRNPMLDGLCQD